MHPFFILTGITVETISSTVPETSTPTTSSPVSFFDLTDLTVESTTSPIPDRSTSTTSSPCPPSNGYGQGMVIVNGLNCTCMEECRRHDFPERCPSHCQGMVCTKW